MKTQATSVSEYLELIPENQREAFLELRSSILQHLPLGYVEVLSYGMIGYVIPLSTYPKGYLNQSNVPLPFINIAYQKNHIALYHLGMYANPQLTEWFTSEYASRYNTKLDMGKSCIRFKNYSKIPYDLISTLCSKITPEEWIQLYEHSKGQ